MVVRNSTKRCGPWQTPRAFPAWHNIHARSRCVSSSSSNRQQPLKLELHGVMTNDNTRPLLKARLQPPRLLKSAQTDHKPGMVLDNQVDRNARGI